MQCVFGQYCQGTEQRYNIVKTVGEIPSTPESHAMRKSLILVVPLLLTACVDDSASYYIDGSNHALTLRREQTYFWQDQATLSLTAARLPDCQRRHALATVAAPAVDVAVFASGDGVWTVRSGSAAWQVETRTCTLSPGSPGAAPGDPVGTFKVRNGKLVFEPAADAAAAAAPAPAPE